MLEAINTFLGCNSRFAVAGLKGDVVLGTLGLETQDMSMVRADQRILGLQVTFCSCHSVFQRLPTRIPQNICCPTETGFGKAAFLKKIKVACGSGFFFGWKSRFSMAALLSPAPNQKSQKAYVFPLKLVLESRPPQSCMWISAFLDWNSHVAVVALFSPAPNQKSQKGYVFLLKLV